MNLEIYVKKLSSKSSSTRYFGDSRKMIKFKHEWIFVFGTITVYIRNLCLYEALFELCRNDNFSEDTKQYLRRHLNKDYYKNTLIPFMLESPTNSRASSNNASRSTLQASVESLVFLIGGDVRRRGFSPFLS